MTYVGGDDGYLYAIGPNGKAAWDFLAPTGATSRQKPPRSTCTPTSPSKNGPSPGSSRPTPGPGATGRRTNSSSSSKPSDYADLSATHTAATSPASRQAGIIRRSA